MTKKIDKKYKKLPIIIEQDEDGTFVAECNLFNGCYSQGDSYEEVMKNISEVIKMCLKEDKNKSLFDEYTIKNVCFSEIAI